jgi:hypothetical protein
LTPLKEVRLTKRLPLQGNATLNARATQETCGKSMSKLTCYTDCLFRQNYNNARNVILTRVKKPVSQNVKLTASFVIAISALQDPSDFTLVVRMKTVAVKSEVNKIDRNAILQLMPRATEDKLSVKIDKCIALNHIIIND